MNNELTLLVEKLKEKQGDIPDLAFSKKLGISRALWTIVKNGKHEPGGKFCNAVLSTFPELVFEVVNYQKSLHEVLTK